MTPEIKHCRERKLIGLSSSIKPNEHHKITELWKQFMPRKHAIINTVSDEFIAAQVFPENVNPQRLSEYTIWASTEVSDLDHVPEGLKTFTIPKGTYAVFLHKGMDPSATYQKIMTKWLPTSGFEIDNRPHFQIMGKKYKNGSADSEEDFYVPVKIKS